MQQSSSVGSSSSFNASTKICCYGLPCQLQTSWTPINPGRRFFGCIRYSHEDACNFFSWYDPPVTRRFQKVINDLLRRTNELSEELSQKNVELYELHAKIHHQQDQINKLHRMLIALLSLGVGLCACAYAYGKF